MYSLLCWEPFGEFVAFPDDRKTPRASRRVRHTHEKHSSPSSARRIGGGWANFVPSGPGRRMKEHQREERERERGRERKKESLDRSGDTISGDSCLSSLNVRGVPMKRIDTSAVDSGHLARGWTGDEGIPGGPDPPHPRSARVPRALLLEIVPSLFGSVRPDRRSERSHDSFRCRFDAMLIARCRHGR